MRTLFRCAIIGLVVAACGLPHTRARACTVPPNWQPPTVSARYAAAEAVLRGTVVAAGIPADSGDAPPFAALSDPLTPEVGVTNALFDFFYRNAASSPSQGFASLAEGYYAVVMVDEYYKGDGAARVIVRGFGYGLDCLNVAWPGETHIFFVTGDSPFFSANYRGPHTALLDVNTATSTALAGLNAVPRAPEEAQSPLWLPLAGLVVALFPLGVRAAWGMATGDLRKAWASGSARQRLRKPAA